MSNNIDNIMKDLPDEIQKIVKEISASQYKKGLIAGAYAVSHAVLRRLSENPNPAKAVAVVKKYLGNKYIDKG